MDTTFIAISSAICVIIAILYRESKKTAELERKLGETLLRENERKNLQDVEDHLAGRTDLDVLNEAIKRGSEMPKPPRGEGDQQ